MTDTARAYMPAAAERRRSPRDPGAMAIGFNLIRFTVALTAFAAAVVKDSRGSVDPITLEPRVLSRPVERPVLAAAH